MSSATATEESICRIIASVLPKAAVAGGVSPGLSLRGDLGIDSFGLMSIIFVLEDQTGIDAMSNIDRFIAAEYVSDIVALVMEG